MIGVFLVDFELFSVEIFKGVGVVVYDMVVDLLVYSGLGYG